MIPENQPIDFYAWSTPQCVKVAICLEELHIAYIVHPVRPRLGEQHSPDSLTFSPNGKTPVIVDPFGADGHALSLSESGAILIYLAQKIGRFCGKTTRESSLINQWLFWQNSEMGPIFSQLTHFQLYALESIPYALERFTQEAEHLLQVMNDWLSSHVFIAEDYSIADMACIAHINGALDLGLTLEKYPHLQRWKEMVLARPGVQKGLAFKERFPISCS
jgi:GST-like protein